ncbi:MAG: aldo/keto reductase [Nitrospinales bacterium]
MRFGQCDGIDKKWSVITLGCWQLAPSDGWGNVCTTREADAVVKSALDQNITAFDTAEGYGDGESERRLAKALGHKKDDVIIISKIWPDAELTLEAYQERLEGTLRTLERDYVDVYLVHWPGSYFDSAEKSEKLCELMFGLKASGKARVIGLSNFHSFDLDLLKDSIHHFSINQIPYSLLERDYEGTTTEICDKAGIQFMAYSPTAQGFLAGRLDAEARDYPARKSNQFYQGPLYPKALKVFEKVKEIAEQIQKTPIEVALAWVLNQKNILTAIVGSRKPWQISNIAAASDVRLSDYHLQQLATASKIFHRVKSLT